MKRREAGRKRDFDDADFRLFVLSDALVKRARELERTLASWKQMDLEAAARRVLVYLPPQARIRAKVFPVIKPQTNSFVFELLTDPTVFLFVDPGVNAEQFENTVAHELHHIGLAERAPDRQFIALRGHPAQLLGSWLADAVPGCGVRPRLPPLGVRERRSGRALRDRPDRLEH